MDREGEPAKLEARLLTEPPAKEAKKPGMLERAGKAVRSLGRMAKDLATVAVTGQEFVELANGIAQWFGLPMPGEK